MGLKEICGCIERGATPKIFYFIYLAVLLLLIHFLDAMLGFFITGFLVFFLVQAPLALSRGTLPMIRPRTKEGKSPFTHVETFFARVALIHLVAPVVYAVGYIAVQELLIQ